MRGLVRVPPDRPRLAPANSPQTNVWYWPELQAMTASAFAAQTIDALPFVVEADARPEPPGGLPRGGVTRIALPNRHLQYALTWYGVALALASVYFAFLIKRLRDGGEE